MNYLIVGSSTKTLASKIQHENITLIQPEIIFFRNNEFKVRIDNKDVINKSVFYIQTLDSNQAIIEALLTIDSLTNIGVASISLIFPYFAYSMQDKIFRSGESLSSKVIASLFNQNLVKNIYLFELHNPATVGFFNKPTFHIQMTDFWASFIKQNLDTQNSLVISPDIGGFKRSQKLATLLNLPLQTLVKSRDLTTGDISFLDVPLDVNNKNIFIYDDIIISGGTFKKACDILKDKGANNIYFFATHGLINQKTIENINNSQASKVFISNTYPINNELLEQTNKLEIVDISDFIKKTILI